MTIEHQVRENLNSLQTLDRFDNLNEHLDISPVRDYYYDLVQEIYSDINSGLDSETTIVNSTSTDIQKLALENMTFFGSIDSANQLTTLSYKEGSLHFLDNSDPTLFDFVFYDRESDGVTDLVASFKTNINQSSNKPEQINPYVDFSITNHPIEPLYVQLIDVEAKFDISTGDYISYSDGQTDVLRYFNRIVDNNFEFMNSHYDMSVRLRNYEDGGEGVFVSNPIDSIDLANDSVDRHFILTKGGENLESKDVNLKINPDNYKLELIPSTDPIDQAAQGVKPFERPDFTPPVYEFINSVKNIINSIVSFFGGK